MRIFGFIPARMAASRFPGKPLATILGMPMIEHVYRRAKLFDQWSGLFLTTCDKEISDFGTNCGFSVIDTGSHHVRCLDRVGEAVLASSEKIGNDDLVVCVQGDEPMLYPEMIEATIKPFYEDSTVKATVLAMHIQDEEQFLNPDTVKIVSDMAGNVAYTSRSPIPYCKEFSPELEARRIYGIFAFRWKFLRTFNSLPESPLEKKESCDSNRILDHGLKQRIAPYPYQKSFSVDSPHDLELVETHMKTDKLWKSYA